mmetsp:Transcript_30438/g.81871  ORF Transcript_30438/g.81871 Transcript_30438/m.81871 type:complete len:453 (-) Transcript_30438:1291-2649(-)
MLSRARSCLGLPVAKHVLAVGHEEHDNGVLRANVRRVTDVETSPLHLDGLPFLNEAEAGLTDGLVCFARVCIDAGRTIDKLVILLEGIFGDEVVNVHEVHVHVVCALRRPGEFLLGLLDISLEVQAALDRRHVARIVLDDFVHDGVTPVHQCHLLALGHEERVLLLENGGGRVPLDLVAQLRVLLVGEDGSSLRSARDTFARELERHSLSACDGGVAHRLWVDDLTVLRPDLVPLHEVVVLRGALHEDEGAEALHVQPAPEDPLDSGHARIIPAVHTALCDEPAQLALGEKALLEIEPREGPDGHGAHTLQLRHTVVLRVALEVLAVAERVRDALVGIHPWAGKVVGGVHLVLGAREVVGREVDAVGGWVAQRAVRGSWVHLGAHAALLSLLGGLLHLLPEAKVLRNWLVARRRRLAVEAQLLLHLRGARVHVGVTALDHLRLRLEELCEVV